MTWLPTGTVTFLFTDIEGSTRILQEVGDAYRGLLETHADILRRAVATVGGQVVSTEGDSFFAVFESAPTALAAAVQAQERLVTHPWPEGAEIRVRMGLHTGLGRLGGDSYVGLDVHRAARLMSVAHGGQIVISEPTHALIRDDPAPEVSFMDLGVHRLKDLAQPEHVYQVMHPRLPYEFPPLRSLEGFPNNLPAQLSSFLGREQTLRKVQEAVEASRLVTLNGPGGVGKTRLALQVAADRIERHPHGVWLSELGGLSEPELVPQAVRSALRIPQQTGRPTLATLSWYLQDKDLLLILDNCEHLIEAAAGLTETLLATAPDVRVLATSREPLRIAGEVTWPVPPMTVPRSDDQPYVESPPETVLLFVERARAADPAFELTDRNAGAIARICRRLDGLPLAIELAAARTRALSVEDIASRLQDRFALLGAGARTALPHQRTLEATVAWSYELLDREERELFAHLSVFRGSFDLEAAEAVAAVGDVEPSRMLELLTGLVDKSLVTAVREDEEVRYRMLETIRQYARDRLDDSPDAEAVRESHTHWALSLAARAGKEVVGPQQRQWLGRIQSSVDDLRAVLERVLERGNPETGLRLMVALDNWWVLTAVPEATYWLERLLAREDEIEAEGLAPGLAFYGQVLTFGQKVEDALPVLERSLELFERIDDPRNQAYAQHVLGISLWDPESPDRARDLNLRALETFERIGDPAGTTRCLFFLGLWELHFGKVEAASALADRLAEVGERTGAPLVKAHGAELRGLSAHFRDRHDEARSRFLEAVAWFRKGGRVQCLVHCLTHVSLWALADDRPEATASLLGAVDTLLREHLGGTGGPVFELSWSDLATERAQEALGPGEFRRQFSEGSERDPEEAVDLADAILGSSD